MDYGLILDIVSSAFPNRHHRLRFGVAIQRTANAVASPCLPNYPYGTGSALGRTAGQPFQNWVIQVVLPAIREDGGYVVGEKILGAEGGITDAEFLGQAALVA